MNRCTPEQHVGQRDIKGKIKKYIEASDSLNRTYHNLWDAAESAKKEFIVLNICS